MSFSDQTKFWNERFNKEEFIFGKEPNEYLVKQAKQYLKPGNAVLCIADGEGRNGVWLAEQGMQVDAFDVSDIALAKAKQFAKDNPINLTMTLILLEGIKCYRRSVTRRINCTRNNRMRITKIRKSRIGRTSANMTTSHRSNYPQYMVYTIATVYHCS